MNYWYTNDEALTETYHADRGYNETMLMWGLNEFLIGVWPAIQTENEHDEEETTASALP